MLLRLGKKEISQLWQACPPPYFSPEIARSDAGAEYSDLDVAEQQFMALYRGPGVDFATRSLAGSISAVRSRLYAPKAGPLVLLVTHFGEDPIELVQIVVTDNQFAFAFGRVTNLDRLAEALAQVFFKPAGVRVCRATARLCRFV